MEHEVLKLIEARREQRSTPGQRDDPCHLALAIEGGGMRGVITAGMVAALEELDLRDVFDSVLGASAGAVNGAYFLTRQARYGTSIYYENLVDHTFIDARRLLPGGEPVLSLRHLLDDVANNRKPLDWTGVLSSDIPLSVLVTNVEDGSPVVFSSFASEHNLREALRASATIPLIAGDAVSVNGGEYLDASVSRSVPFRTAIDGGATHVLVLRSRPQGVLRGKLSPLERSLILPYLRVKYGPRLANAYKGRAVRYRDEVEEIELAPGALQIFPPATPKVGQREQQVEVLVAGAKAGWSSVMDVFGRTGEVPVATLTPFPRPGKTASI
jgi:predicted patatin/cPLA2 family phospholipase